MTGIFIQNIESAAEIVTTDYYGADFKVSVFDQEDNTYLIENISMTELIEPITNVSTSTTNNQLKDDKDIELDDASALNVSDRIKIGNYIYKINSIFGNNIIINRGLLENIDSGSTVSNKGNLGIYKVNLNFGDLGTFTLIGKDSIFGLNIARMIKVQPKSIETMYKDIKNLEYAILGS